VHFLAERPGFICAFSDDDALRFGFAFPLMLKQLELMLINDELNPGYQHYVKLYHNRLTCEADTLGSCGYVYIAVYPTQR
jgi:cytoskeleton bundling-enhancing protein CbeA-like protein